MNQDPYKLLTSVMIDIADAILMGIPGTVIMSNVRNRYQLEAESLLNLIEEAEKELRSAEAMYLSDQEKRVKLLDSLRGRNPLGTAYRQVQDELKSQVEDKTIAAQAKVDELNSQLDKANQIGARSLGTHVVEQVEDYYKRGWK